MTSSTDGPIEAATFTVEPHVGASARCQTLFTSDIRCGQNATVDVISALGEVFHFCAHCSRGYRGAADSDPNMPPDMPDLPGGGQ